MTFHNLWTAERLDLLRDLLRAGLSASQIADKLRVTRNAVIGATHRHLGAIRAGKAASTRRRVKPTLAGGAPTLASMATSSHRGAPSLAGGLPKSAQVPTMRLPNSLPVVPEPIQAPTVRPPQAPVPFGALAPGECRYPLWGDERSTRLLPACGRPVTIGSYCMEHHLVTHRCG